MERVNFVRRGAPRKKTSEKKEKNSEMSIGI